MEKKGFKDSRHNQNVWFEDMDMQNRRPHSIHFLYNKSSFKWKWPDHYGTQNVK